MRELSSTKNLFIFSTLAAVLSGYPAISSSAVTNQSVQSAGVTQQQYLRAVYVNGNAANGGNGSQAAPYKTISAAMRNLVPGDDVIIAPGVYREQIVVPALPVGGAPTRIRAQTPGTVTVKGSDVVSGWHWAWDSVYQISWDGDEPEQVYRNGISFQQVGGTVFSGYPNTNPPELEGQQNIWPGRVNGNVNQLTANTFTYAKDSKILFVKVETPPQPNDVWEVSTRTYVLNAENAHNLTVDGIEFAHSNTSFKMRAGAVKVQGGNNVLKNLRVHDMDAACVSLIGGNSSLLSSEIWRCGQVGVTGRGSYLTFDHNKIHNNNTRYFSPIWEAGGMKLIGPNGEPINPTYGANHSIFTNNEVTFNHGNGIWFDWKNNDNLIQGNVLAYNSDFGLFYEVSQYATIKDNQSYGNGYGIILQGSSNSLIEHNAVFSNVNVGIAVQNDGRNPGGAVGNRIKSNSITWNDSGRSTSNWVQLRLPTPVKSQSDCNRFIAQGKDPRVSVESTGVIWDRVSWWSNATTNDRHSTSEVAAPPSALQGKLNNKMLLQPGDLPAVLATPGVQQSATSIVPCDI